MNNHKPYKDQFTPWKPLCAVSNTGVYDLITNKDNWPPVEILLVLDINDAIIKAKRIDKDEQ